MAEPSSLSMFSSGMGIASAGIGILSGIFGAAAEREEATATGRALRLEKNYNLGVLAQQKTDSFWADTMSSWRSGVSYGEGTSTAAVIDNNQDVIQKNIDFQKSQYDIKVKNANTAANRRFLGVF